MKFCMKFGDTNFIGLVNASEYKSFVNEDWQLGMLLNHFSDEMRNGNILVFEMTNRGVQHSWNIEIQIGKTDRDNKYFRSADGYIKVTNNKLYIIDYDCLTISAQFEDESVPDKNCSKNEIDLNNGIYKVVFDQFYNADSREFTGKSDIDILITLIEVSNFEVITDRVFWCTYY
ncbi:hypothetical protein GC093_02605 [Paenibacillus sp. LMG 31456]|uniref:Uncharacterized protein n=1 Tax=Paenibacillus foliorum TaxID=2654974 RepID=A0A972GK01_9BACL|nr:hypothetical protein [Paenibacillus foliorum]NOU92127.1 hypothetical protein [Paenibacillus foliorum]